jgi:TonB family protein
MTIKIHTILSLIFISLSAAAQDFIISHGDTINRTDVRGRRQGMWTFTDVKGIRVEMQFRNDFPIDTIRYYEKNALRLVYKRSGPDTIYYTYSNGKFSCSNYFTADTINYCSDQPAIRAQIKRFITYEIPPSFYGGDTAMRSYLKNKMKDFPECQKGTVKVAFTVDEAGRPTQARIQSSDNPELNNSCLRAVLDMPRWQPAYENGNITREPKVVPIICK